MTKFFHIAWYEYSRNVFRKRFIFALLSVPVMLLVMIGMVFLVIVITSDSTPIGYVDHSRLLDNAVPQPAVKWPERKVPMRAYTEETAANADLEAGRLQVYYIIPSDYLQTGDIQQVYLKEPKGINTEQFNSFLKVNLLSGQPPEIANRILDGSTFVVHTTATNQASTEQNFVNLILPFAAGIIFIIAMSSTSGYLMHAVVEEKENRTMEILVTSVSTNQIMSGKIIGDMAVGLTQLFVWSVFVVFALVFAKRFVPALGDITFSGEQILLIMLVMVPAFVMISALVAAVGATVTSHSEGTQIMSLFTIPIWIPYVLIALFIQNPNSPLAIAMSLFPLTAPVTLAIRMGITTVPTWQLIASITILILSAIGAVWFAGRAFRMGLLRYGQRVRLSEIFSHGRA